MNNHFFLFLEYKFSHIQASNENRRHPEWFTSHVDFLRSYGNRRLSFWYRFSGNRIEWPGNKIANLDRISRMLLSMFAYTVTNDV